MVCWAVEVLQIVARDGWQPQLVLFVAFVEVLETAASTRCIRTHANAAVRQRVLKPAQARLFSLPM